MTCLNSKCYRPGVAGSQPYWSWAEFVRQFSNQASFLLFGKICGSSLGQIAKIVPELSEFVATFFTPSPSAATANASSPELVQREEMILLSTVAQFFFRLAGEAHLLLVMDDFQWCDPASLKLLQFMESKNLQEHRIMLLRKVV